MPDEEEAMKKPFAVVAVLSLLAFPVSEASAKSHHRHAKSYVHHAPAYNARTPRYRQTEEHGSGGMAFGSPKWWEGKQGGGGGTGGGGGAM
jgi:uncharacterized membrane protein YgcG